MNPGLIATQSVGSIEPKEREPFRTRRAREELLGGDHTAPDRVLDDADLLPSVVAAGLFDDAGVVLTWIDCFAGVAPVTQFGGEPLDGALRLTNPRIVIEIGYAHAAQSHVATRHLATE
jgi:hypothetical protein